MHPKQAVLEKDLSRMCMSLDNYLEDLYGNRFTIHPNRPRRGQAANPSNDGLFSTGTMFTLGYGSKYGRGYIIDMEIRTLSSVSKETRDEIEEVGVKYLNDNLRSFFPDRKLNIVRDKTVWKLIGDFSLGEV